MSRIYEALQRAEHERTDAQPDRHDSGPVRKTPISETAEPLAAVIPADFETSSRRPWNPCMVSLPAVAERGECVEQFRSLRSHLYLQRLQAHLKTILISSGMPGEGKTFVASNLAISLARNNQGRVLLIDADLRRSTLHRILGAPPSPGLADYLVGTSTLTDILQCPSVPAVSNGQDRDISNVSFIPAGGSPDNSVELVGSRRIEELIATVSPHFDWVVIDAPPVLAVTDAVDLARAADGVLLVAREAQTPFDVAQRAQAAFTTSRVLGFVLNAVKNAPASSYYYHYYNDHGRLPSDGSQRHEKRRIRK